MKYIVSNTEMMVFRSGKAADRIPEVYLDEPAVNVVNQFKYLGHLLIEGLRDGKDVERKW